MEDGCWMREVSRRRYADEGTNELDFNAAAKNLKMMLIKRTQRCFTQRCSHS